MASFFGEVLLPVSRAFWDDDDADENDSLEDINNIRQTDFSVRWLKEKPVNFETLIIVESTKLTDFAKECLCPNSEEVCIINNEKQKKVAALYQSNSDTYLCNILPGFDIKHSGIFINKISDILSKAKNTIAITCQHVTHFQKEEPPNASCFLRMLNTKQAESICKLKAQRLEQPNIVFGIGAGVLSYAEFMEWPASLYILYIDSFILDSNTAEPLIKLFEAFDCVPHDVKFAGKSFFNKGNLYM